MQSKIFSTVCFTLLIFSPMVWGMAMEEHQDHQNSAVVSESVISATGTIKSIAPDRMSVRIFHNPIPALNWPAMNMPFSVADPELLHSLQVGDKVRFEFVQKEGSDVIVKISK